jgi:putative chitinase
LPLLQAALVEFEINTYLREAMFLAQIAHESGEFQWMKEIWGPTAAQRKYEPPSEKASELGNTKAGDGKRYMGRGVIQLTGRANYRTFGQILGVDLEGNPDLAAAPEWAFRTAGLFWKKKGINQPSDRRDVRAATKLVNGGFNGIDERRAYYDRAILVLSKNDALTANLAVRVLVDGKDVTAMVKPFVADGRTMVAIKPIAQRTGMLILGMAGGNVTLRDPNGANHVIPLVIKDGTGFVPLREVPVPLDWDAATNTASVTTG